MTIWPSLAIFFSLVCSFSLASANPSLDSFRQRFSVTTNAVGERIIVDNSLKDGNGLDLYIQNMASYLKPNPAEFSAVYADAHCAGFNYEDPNQELSNTVDAAISWMQKSHIGDVLTAPKFLEFLKKMSALGDQFVQDKDYEVMAHLSNPKYFHDKAFFKFFQKKVKGLVDNYFEANAYLKVVSFMGNDYANWVARKKLYHQNFLRYYLETSNAEDLGLTESERGKALSSIEDSRLSFGLGGFLDSRKIAKDFEGYGIKKLIKTDADSDKRWNKYSKLFDARLGKIDALFSEVSFQGSPIVLNLSLKKSWADKKPSFAFDPACPNFQYENRRRYELARVGLSLFPIPYSGQLSKLFKSKYEPQSLEEGLLYAHLESINSPYKADILKQSVNPLLK